MRRIQLELHQSRPDPGGPATTVAAATLFLDLAPVACATLWDLLPIETRAIQTIWAGENWRTEADYPLLPDDIGTENPAGNVDLVPGDLCFFRYERPRLRKIVFAYGRARWPHDDVSRIGRVDEGLPDFLAASSRVLMDGAQQLTLRRLE